MVIRWIWPIATYPSHWLRPGTYPRSTELLRGLLRAGELTKGNLSRKYLLHFSEILLMITAWKRDRVLKTWWSLAREHYTWNAKQPLLQQLFPVLSINGRPQNKSPNSYPPCPPHLNAHLGDGSGSFLLLPTCFFLMQPSHCLPIHFSPPFVKQWVKASYSQGTRQWKATAYIQNTLRNLMLQFCFHYCAPPPLQLEWDHLSFSNCIRICINAQN